VATSSIIVVGNEILRGFTVDTNSNWLAAQLFHCGFPVTLITTIGDVDEDIVGAVRHHLGRRDNDRIFVCGGLGPTPDDRTFAALGTALGRELVVEEAVRERIERRLARMVEAKLIDSAELTEGLVDQEGRRDQSLRARRFQPRTKIYSSSAMPRASSNHLPAKEFITRCAPASWPQTRPQRLFAARIGS